MPTLALVGAAHIHTPAYIDVLTHRADTYVPLVWDHDEHRAQQAAGHLEAQPTMHIQDVWDNDAIDAVVICSETPLHTEHLLGAIRFGKAVFVEKPLTLSPRDAFQVATEADRMGIVLHTGFFLRYHPSISFLRTVVRDGAFGHITRIHASFGHAGGLDGWFDDQWSWMADPEQMGPDAFHDLAIHLVDLLTWINGPVERVIYDTGAVAHRYPELDEFGAGMMRFQQGSLGMIDASWVDRESPLAITIHGTEGYATLRADGLDVRGPAAERLAWREMPPLSMSPADGLVPYLDVLSGNVADLVPVHDAARVIAIMDAFSRSKASSSWEVVDTTQHA